jgi:hypothetical protein
MNYQSVRYIDHIADRPIVSMMERHVRIIRAVHFGYTAIYIDNRCCDGLRQHNTSNKQTVYHVGYIEQQISPENYIDIRGTYLRNRRNGDTGYQLGTTI